MPEFTYGDSVRVVADAPANARPGSAAEIVGISQHDERHGSCLEKFPEGVVYTVEFDDGSAADVRECHLVPLAVAGERQ